MGVGSKVKKIVPNEEYCLGCGLCEIFCAVEHSTSKDIITAMKHEYPKPVGRTVVELKGHEALALSCRHCEDAPCLTACMTGALYRDEDATVRHDDARCVGCWMCVMVCPYGAIKRDTAERRAAAKCDFCPDRETPACVEACPNEALILVEVVEAAGEGPTEVND